MWTIHSHQTFSIGRIAAVLGTIMPLTLSTSEEQAFEEEVQKMAK